MRDQFQRLEAVLAAVLFLISVYGAVYLVRIREYGWAGMAMCCALGFFRAMESFGMAADWRDRLDRKEQEDADRAT
jgi:hypothetical protein